MQVLTVKLDEKHAQQIARLARRYRTSKSEVVRNLIDRSERIETGQDLEEWIASNSGAGFGLRIPRG